MSDNGLSSHTLRMVATIHLYDWAILVLLGVIEIVLNVIEPFHHFIEENMMTDFKYPFKKNTIPFWAVPFIAVLLPVVVILLFYFRKRNVYDLHHAILGLMFSVAITGVITDSIKDAVGRPRPNFFWRCFPDGNAVFDQATRDVLCTGDESVIKEGYKSFPSGHTSWSFAGLTFLAWYSSGKIRAFDRRGHVAKLCVVFLPLLLAALIGVSRVDDYWHHWTDVFGGGLIGLTVASVFYLHLYQPPHCTDGCGPRAYFHALSELKNAQECIRLREEETEIETA